MHTVLSRDGTRIACQVIGEGPPLVLVHGAGTAATRWAAVAPELGRHFTVYAMDRRGRGASGDSADYSMPGEFEDVEAVLKSIDAPVNLLGHSFGGICAYEVAARVSNLRRLIVYEPPVAPLADDIEVFSDRMERMLERGLRDEVVATFMREIVKRPEAEIEKLRAQPGWLARTAAAHTLPREGRALATYRSDPEYVLDRTRFADYRVPTLILLGGASPETFRSGVELVASALPGSRIEVLPGQQHNAMDTAPGLFVQTVLDFLLTDD